MVTSFTIQRASDPLKLLVDIVQAALIDSICVTGYTLCALTHTHKHTIVRPVNVMTMWCTVLSDGPIKVSDVGCLGLTL